MTALDQFNAAFDFHFCEPLPAGGLEKLVDYARLRGRDDIAMKMLAAYNSKLLLVPSKELTEAEFKQLLREAGWKEREIEEEWQRIQEDEESVE